MKQLHKIARNAIAVLPERPPSPTDSHRGPTQETTEEIGIAADVAFFDGPGHTADEVDPLDEKDSTEE